MVSAAIWTKAEIETLVSSAKSAEGQKAVRVELQGVNSILKVYGLGGAPTSPEIDGPELADSAVFKTSVATAINMSAGNSSSDVSSIDPSLSLSLNLLDVADRLDAIIRWPEYESDNRASFLRKKRVKWIRYKYAALVVLGVGPDDLQTPLSARGKRNVQMAAELYFQQQAPVIIVSGGSVHPRRTKYVEAFEMRKALIERFHVPADAIVVDPFARHTTTNLRNASRLLFALGAPSDKASLIVSNEEQITYVLSEGFKDRNLSVLRYQPALLEGQTSPTTVPFQPNSASFLVDPADPLDP